MVVVVFVTLRVTAVLISRSMEGVMNQLKQYEGPWDLGQRKAEDQARRKAKRGKTNTKELKKAADEETARKIQEAVEVRIAAERKAAEEAEAAERRIAEMQLKAEEEKAAEAARMNAEAERQAAEMKQQMEEMKKKAYFAGRYN